MIYYKGVKGVIFNSKVPRLKYKDNFFRKFTIEIY
jgi:hypothetical protein